MAKILMVDDDGEFLEAGKSVLEAKGHEVITAQNASLGKEKALSENPDIIFLDIMMEQPDDGIDLAHKLKKENISAKIVMLSGVSRVSGLDYGKCNEALPCEDFLEKPIKPEDLIKKVDSLLNK
jgi:DNA-binding response OmpR family regulator